ncbi:MAG: RDD family protein [Planctomycetaceae bacterium]|nr:RDD family protein [Planctomycetaceae bacterium]
MPVKVRCPQCRKVMAAPDKARGKAIRCTECKTPVRVPAGDSKEKPTRSKSASGSSSRRKAAVDEDDLFGSLDLRMAEDRSIRMCPGCGTQVDEENIDCPKCGVNIDTGLPGVEMKRKAALRKGVDPTGYFDKGLKDAFRFTMKFKKLSLRTAMYGIIFGLLAFGCGFMVNWCSRLPPKAFWSFVGLVMALAVPGWTWHLWTEVINLTLSKKKKPGRYPFDLFQCSALGIKYYVWLLVFVVPLMLITGAIGGALIVSGLLWVGLALILLSFLVALPAVPISMSHMAMPIQNKGWMFWKILPKVYQYAGPCLHWSFFFVLSMLPMSAVLVAGNLLGAADMQRLQADLHHNNQISLAKNYESLSKEEPPAWVEEWKDQEPKEPDYQALLIPAGTLVLANLLFAVGAVFSMRLNGQLTYYLQRDLDLEMQAKEVKYVSSREARENPLKAPAANFGPRAVAYIVDLLFLDGLIGGMSFAVTELMRMYEASQQTILSVAGASGVVTLLAMWLYFAKGESSEAMATRGKNSSKLFVVDMNGERLTFGKATARFLVKYFLSGPMTLYGGYLMAAFDKDGRALHDRICGTMVKKG